MLYLRKFFYMLVLIVVSVGFGLLGLQLDLDLLLSGVPGFISLHLLLKLTHISTGRLQEIKGQIC